MRNKQYTQVTVLRISTPHSIVTAASFQQHTPPKCEKALHSKAGVGENDMSIIAAHIPTPTSDTLTNASHIHSKIKLVLKLKVLCKYIGLLYEFPVTRNHTVTEQPSVISFCSV